MVIGMAGVELNGVEGHSGAGTAGIGQQWRGQVRQAGRGGER